MKDMTPPKSSRPAEQYVGLPDESLQTTTLQLLRELLDVAAAVRPAVARRASLSHNELHVLELLFEGPAGPSDLARRLGVTSAASSGIVARLEERGHVTRAPHASDGRRHQVTLTDSGAAEVMGHLAPMFAALHELDVGLDDEQRRVVERYLAGAVAALRRLL